MGYTGLMYGAWVPHVPKKEEKNLGLEKDFTAGKVQCQLEYSST